MLKWYTFVQFERPQHDQYNKSEFSYNRWWNVNEKKQHTNIQISF